MTFCFFIIDSELNNVSLTGIFESFFPFQAVKVLQKF